MATEDEKKENLRKFVQMHGIDVALYEQLIGKNQGAQMRRQAQINAETLVTKADLNAQMGNVLKALTAVSAGGEKFDEGKLLAGVQASAKQGTLEATATIKADIAGALKEAVDQLDLGDDIAGKVLAAIDNVTIVDFNKGAAA